MLVINIFFVLVIICLVFYLSQNKKENFKNDNIKKTKPDIKDFLLEYKNKQITYIPNPGNGGDSLIASGTFKLFKELDLDYVIGENKVYKDSILFYAGGGNLVGGLYSNCKNFINKNMGNNNVIVVLPHTIKSSDDLLKKLDKNVILICREQVSYDYVRSTIKHPKNVYLYDDMAFQLKNMKEKLSNQKDKNRYKIGNFYRSDKESKYNRNIKGNVDLSTSILYDYKMNNKELVNKNTLDIFKEVNRYKEINTDRLHIAITGTLLGKKTNMHQNSYYKNKAVYEQSIKDKYPNTILKD